MDEKVFTVEREGDFDTYFKAEKQAEKDITEGIPKDSISGDFYVSQDYSENIDINAIVTRDISKYSREGDLCKHAKYIGKIISHSKFEAHDWITEYYYIPFSIMTNLDSGDGDKSPLNRICLQCLKDIMEKELIMDNK